ncbi:MAG: Fic family protein [bacterium]
MGTNLKSPNGYSYFLPDPINIDHTFSSDVYNLCIKATDKLAELRAFSSFVPDVDFFIQMHISKEAVDSNKIEGTKTEIDDLFLEEGLFDDEKRDEIEEVKNYTKALNYGINRLDTLPISTRLIKEIHNVLMQGVRGKNKNPGEFRTSQNWIGGVTISDAHFIPPSFEHIGELTSDLEKFLHYNDCPDLIKAGIIHFQFETIHPFLDGNGRVGRLVIILYLIQAQLLHKPVLYISQFFEKNRNLYYENLDLARGQKGLEPWLKFFLVGVYETANNNLQTLQKIVNLKSQLESKILELGKKGKNAKKLIDYLYSHPIVNVASVETLLKISKTAANNLLNDLEKLGILKEKTKFKRNRIFYFENYIGLFEN